MNLNFANTWGTPVPLEPPFHKDYRLCRFEGTASGALCYLVTKNGARKLLDFVYPIRMPADDIIGRTAITGLALYGVTPNPVRLADLQSTIWKDANELNQLQRFAPGAALRAWRRVRRLAGIARNVILRR